MSWSSRFKPDDWSQIVGNDETRQRFLRWLSGWKPKQKKRAALLFGPPGTGKTIIVELAAKKLGYNLIELSASDERTRDVFAEKIYPASRSMSLYNQRNVILLDEIDGLHLRQDIGSTSAILKLMEETSAPIVMTANDPWKPSLREIRLRSETFELKRLRKESVAKMLREFVRSQGILAEDGAIERIAEMCHGDMRSAIADLEALASEGSVLREQTVSQVLQNRTKEESIFEAIRGAMYSRSVWEARNHLDSTGLRVDELIDWIFGNISNIASDPTSREILAGATADSDFLSALMRTKRSWMFIPYVYDILSTGLMACGSRARTWVKLNMPSRISQRWARLARTRQRDAEAMEVGSQLHERRSVVKSQTIELLERITGGGSVRSKLRARPKKRRRAGSARSKVRGR